MVYRRGAVSEGEIVRALTAAGLHDQFKVRIVCKPFSAIFGNINGYNY